MVDLEVILACLWKSFWESRGKRLGGRLGCLMEVVWGFGKPLGDSFGPCERVHVEWILAELLLPDVSSQ